MSAEENKAIVRRWIEIWNTGNVSAVAASVTPDFVRHDPHGPEIRRAEAENEFVSVVLTAFPDLHITIEKLMAEGDMVVGHFTLRGSQREEFFGIPPTQKQVSFTSMEIFRLQGDKIAEQWVNMDTLGLFQQLGVIP